MSPASYLTAPPRDVSEILPPAPAAGSAARPKPTAITSDAGERVEDEVVAGGDDRQHDRERDRAAPAHVTAERARVEDEPDADTDAPSRRGATARRRPGRRARPSRASRCRCRRSGGACPRGRARRRAAGRSGTARRRRARSPSRPGSRCGRAGTRAASGGRARRRRAPVTEKVRREVEDVHRLDERRRSREAARWSGASQARCATRSQRRRSGGRGRARAASRAAARAASPRTRRPRRARSPTWARPSWREASALTERLSLGGTTMAP